LLNIIKLLKLSFNFLLIVIFGIEMNLRVLVPVANGTEDVEAVTIIDLLRRANIDVVVAGTESPIIFARGLNILPDMLIDDIRNDEYFDAIILPGGIPGVNYLSEHKHLQNLLKSHISEKRLTGAICAAPLILKEHKHLNSDVEITSFPSLRTEFNEYKYLDEDVVVHNNFVTSRGLGTAIPFSLKIIELLIDKNKSDSIAKEIVYKSI
jgi:4-methyl-5(b-hydroxyethyl)-thiazole monophosphate biosynthesis